ncbi:MAG: M23 family metallopeptidase [Rhodospirillales bacterium]
MWRAILSPAAVLAAYCLFPALAAAEGPPALSMPVDCRLNENCWLVNFYDHDSGPGVEDYACGVQTYDGHEGLDIGVRDYAVMRAGVNVIAAADGVAAGVRDGEADFAHVKGGPEAVKSKECGNGARVDHGGGWSTLYCHLLKGSIVITEGQRVKRGDIIGQIGMSGKTDFPHVELSVLKDRKTIDPFLGSGGMSVCEISEDALWAENNPVRGAYTFGPLYAAGFAERGVKFDEIKDGQHRATELSASAPALVFYAASYWTKPGDVWELTVTGPDKSVVIRREDTVTNGKAHAMIFSGRKRPGAAWPQGAYTGTVTLTRGAERLTLSRKITVR